MLREEDLKGIYVPVVTPFLSDEALDLDSYRNYLGQLLRHDVQGLVINGTTGESPTVSWNEVVELVQAAKSVMNARGQRIPLIIGAGTSHTRTTVERIELAGQIGVDAVLVVTPYYSRPSQEGILEHFRRAAQVGVPVIAYEIPSRTGIRLSVDTVRRIMEIPGVIGLKDSSGGVELLSSLSSHDRKPVLCGEDLYFHDMLRLGASGGMLASANIRTDAFIDVFRYADRGDFIKAEQLFDSLIPIIQLLFQESNPSPLKWLLAQQGIIESDTVRLPMGPVTKGLQVQLAQLLRH
ncbi:4-hydroxy-tetrahydrodipicolinate synthase [Paenibacillus spongiae]|uniref:4-hydroxy-tetrahydrodipicolinate synthase n=1 Tax=Paenibacillus spongiae TaxID=2909671 RepID=A0ABY5S9B0_9BACL|nr:4-hydroxy-tetrahydrodipicolinate synthase [Paenibacillus spongiae]UVI29412.1 4-hydroxy-tetrahydrodipicolinate synthase [Paenibacillus spongiae]